MRKNIIQSKTEPNKNDIWLSEEGLKKYGKNGWEPLGGDGINASVEFYTIDLDNYSEKDYNNYQKAKADGKSIYVIKNGKHFLGTIGYHGLIVKEPVIYGSKEYLNSNLNSIYTLKTDSYTLEFQYYDEYYCYVKSNGTNFNGFETYVSTSEYNGTDDNYGFIANKIIVTFSDGELKNKQIIFHKAFNFNYRNNPSNVYIGFFSSDKKSDTGEIDYTAKTIEVFYADFFVSNNTLKMYVNKFNLGDKSGEGTKFLSDDGTYKEVSGGQGMAYSLGEVSINSSADDFLNLTFNDSSINQWNRNEHDFIVITLTRSGYGSQNMYLTKSFYQSYQSSIGPYYEGIIYNAGYSSKYSSYIKVRAHMTSTGINIIFLGSAYNEPYIWDGTTSSDIYSKLRDCVTNTTDIMYKSTNSYYKIVFAKNNVSNLILGYVSEEGVKTLTVTSTTVS